jgi:hypothetical protein
MSFKSLIARLMQTARNQVFKLDQSAVNQGIRFADQTLDQFETNISNKIGTPLPIDFSIEELFGAKLRTLSSNAVDKIEARAKEKDKERAERREDREELEREREARHVQALEDISARYQDKLKDINKRSFATVPETIIHFFPPPTTRIIGGIETTVEEEYYNKTFSGDVIPDLFPPNINYRGFNPRNIASQGATEKDIEIINNARKEPGKGGKMFISINFSNMSVREVGRGRNKRIEATSSYEVLLEPSKTTKGATPELSKEEADKLREEAKLQYQRELEEENLLWEEEKKQYRQTDRENRDLEKEAREKAKEEEKEKKKQARIKRRENRPENREAERQKRKDEQEDRQQEREDRQEARQQERENRQENRQQERENRQQEREDQRELERELEQTRKDSIDEVKQLREAGDITREQERDLIRQIREATTIEDIKEKKDRKFDTSFLRNPLFVQSVYQTSYQFLPQQTKNELSESLNQYKEILNQTVTYISIVRGVLTGVKAILSTLGKTGQTLDITGTAINAATNTITSLPIPTGAPIGVGLPLNVITSLSQNLDRLSVTSQKVQGAGDLINEAAPPISDKIEDTSDTLEIILDVIIILLDIIIFLTYVANSGQVPLEEIQAEFNEEFSDALDQAGNSSSTEENIDNNNDLLSRLQPNSNNPLFYKGFRLTIEYKKSESSLTQTRVNGLNSTNGVSLSTDLSFTTSPEVLVKEIQFQIDNYNLIFVTDPFTLPNEELINPDDISVDVDVIIPDTELELPEIEIEGLPQRFTRKEIRGLARKDRKQDRKERREERKSGEITRKEARKDRKQDRKERKQERKDRRKNRIRKRER